MIGIMILSQVLHRKICLIILMKKGLKLPDGLSVDEHMGIQKGRMLERKEGITSETKMGDMSFLSTLRILDDGGFIQNFTDISEIKKHEEALEIQKERFSVFLEIYKQLFSSLILKIIKLLMKFLEN